MKFRYKLISHALFTLLLIVPATIIASGISNNANAIKKIDSSFINLCHENKFSGTVLIAMNGKIKFEKSCGLANRDFHVPNTINTKYNLGSVGKIFTIVSIAQLIEAKKMSLDTHAFNLIPSWLPMQDGKLITVEQLLIHASGLGNFMNDKRWQLAADSGLYNEMDDYRPLISNEKLLFKPGTSQAYSNSGYFILGKIIEKISHESYVKYINRHIFDDANMANTGIYPLDEIIQNRSVGYYYKCNKSTCKWKNNNYEAPFIGTAAGGAYSTVDDLFKFSQAMYGNKLLNSFLTRQVLSTSVIQPDNNIFVKNLKIGNRCVPENFSTYGFAGAWNKFGIAVWENPDLIGHTGGTDGAAALFVMSPDNKYTIIILSNISDGTTPLYQKIREAFGFSDAIKNF